MLDPFSPPPAFLVSLVQPLATSLNLSTLPLHIHEVLFSFVFYLFVNHVAAPALSRRLFPSIYPTFNARTKVNWDVHVVSLVQSCLINVLALWVMWADEERKALDWSGRVWGYTGGGGLVQALAAGYFLWDICISFVHVQIFGWGMLAHAVAALAVFSLGFRPFVNFYGPNFILYELSSPFLNFHWFFDKVQMTGSRAQLYNGIALLAMFFSCRLVWGTYQSLRVYQDVWRAFQSNNSTILLGSPIAPATAPSVDERAEVMRFTQDLAVPVWLAVIYLGSNVVLNTLNFYWFSKMIETVRKRFEPPEEEDQVDGILKAEEWLKAEFTTSGEILTAERTEVRRRREVQEPEGFEAGAI